MLERLYTVRPHFLIFVYALDDKFFLLQHSVELPSIIIS